MEMGQVRLFLLENHHNNTTTADPPILNNVDRVDPYSMVEFYSVSL